MSAQDYLIKPIEELLSFLTLNYPKPFIDCTPYAPDNWIYHKFCHTPFYGKTYGSVYGLRGLKGKIGRNAVRLIDKGLLKLQPDMKKRLDLYGRKYYGGSQWWILPDKLVLEILEFVKNNSMFVKDLYDCIPDEIFFQTIAMQTSFAPLIEVNSPDQVSQNSLTYANFSPPGKKFCGHPHTITVDDWSWLCKRREYIARKFDIETSPEIFDIIDEAHKDIKINSN